MPLEEELTVFVRLIVAAINSMSGLSSQVVMLIKKLITVLILFAFSHKHRITLIPIYVFELPSNSSFKNIPAPERSRGQRSGVIATSTSTALKISLLDLCF